MTGWKEGREEEDGNGGCTGGLGWKEREREREGKRRNGRKALYIYRSVVLKNSHYIKLLLSRLVPPCRAMLVGDSFIPSFPSFLCLPHFLDCKQGSTSYPSLHCFRYTVCTASAMPLYRKCEKRESYFQ